MKSAQKFKCHKSEKSSLTDCILSGRKNVGLARSGVELQISFDWLTLKFETRGHCQVDYGWHSVTHHNLMPNLETPKASELTSTAATAQELQNQLLLFTKIKIFFHDALSGLRSKFGPNSVYFD